MSKRIILPVLLIATLALTGYIAGNLFLGVKACEETTEEETPKQETSAVESIVLSHVSEGKVEWSVDGYSATGFKLVWSKNPNPTYPTRDGDKFAYYNNPSQTSGSISDFAGDGTYFVRVCEYVNGKCGVYSNEVEIVFETAQESEEEEEEKTEESTEEVVTAASYFDKFFNRLRKLDLKTDSNPSAIVTPQGKVTLINAKVESVEGSMLKVSIFSLNFEVDSSQAKTDNGEGFEVGNRLLIKGVIDDNGIIQASNIHDRSTRMSTIDRIKAEIEELLQKIEKLRAELKEL